jgi:hypothetical protein
LLVSKAFTTLHAQLVMVVEVEVDFAIVAIYVNNNGREKNS